MINIVYTFFYIFEQVFFNNSTDCIFCWDWTGKNDKLEDEEREGFETPEAETCLVRDDFLEFFWESFFDLDFALLD